MIDTYLPNSPIDVLNGVGPQKKAAFEKAGIKTLKDLLLFYPKSYRSNSVNRLASAPLDEPSGFLLTVLNNPTVFYYPKGKKMLRFCAGDDSGKADVIFFNAPFLKQKFQKGETFAFYGVLKEKNNKNYIFSPQFTEKEKAVFSGVTPIYPAISGVQSKTLVKLIQQALLHCDSIIEETLPEHLLRKYNFPKKSEAVKTIHFPTSSLLLKKARERGAFEELFFFSYDLLKLKHRKQSKFSPPMRKTPLAPFFNALPFELTGAQKNCINEITVDLTEKNYPLNRLLQGDVGSGKTVVAAAAAYLTVKNEKTAIVMAPTEILARQHYAGLKKIFDPLNIPVHILTGSSTKKERDEVQKNLASPGILIGTHALIEENVTIPNAAFAAVDEQHRFGVNQRQKLIKKLIHENVLYMSATPIPRTLAMFLYSDMDISIIDELPPGRKKVRTFFVDDSYEKRIIEFIKKQKENGNQTFVVCPAIEENDLQQNLVSAELVFEKLSFALPELKLGLLHGKLKNLEKDHIMADFNQKKLDILVSTTVIEVGIDVPNATLMIVENADRFGLAQLHQLRGRVGRGKAESFCILKSSSKSKTAKERLNMLTKTDNGFSLAEFDLKTRGPGEFFGERQSGHFSLINLSAASEKLLLCAKKEAEALLLKNK